MDTANASVNLPSGTGTVVNSKVTQSTPEPPARDVAAAIQAWKGWLGKQAVVDAPEQIRHYAANASGSKITPKAVVRPAAADQVVAIVRIAAEHRCPLYPTSTGRNWGYGSSTPVTDSCVVLDLSALTSIRFVDRELGLIELEPGVTQGMLHDYLQRSESDWMVPVHGGGPDCSLIGNALERGYGLTPVTDHFHALTSLEAVLADGTLYRSPFRAMGAATLAAAHRWQIGPYTEGLFSQGNLGVVTKATFTLRKRPEHTEAFFIRLRNENEFLETVGSVREILSSLNGSVAGVNLMNDRRVLSMSRPYPNEEVGEHQIISDDLLESMTAKAGISAWTAAGVIHCPKSMVRTIRREIRKRLPSTVSRPIHMNRKRIDFASRSIRLVSRSGGPFLQQLRSIDAFIDLAEGRPRRVALPLAYWLSGQQPDTATSLDPARDGCGLIWYSPLVPMKRDVVRQFTKMVNDVCKQHFIEPLITLTTLSDAHFDSTVPILFRRDDPEATTRAQACFRMLLREGQKLGCLPYRLPTFAMETMSDACPSGQPPLPERIRNSLDPHRILSPGRYCPADLRD
jgi:4-cresol dehydrogenase (hydroxylating)